MSRHAKHYCGFISYSHGDKVEAARLLKRLQTYRLPKSSAGETRRLGNFFMDRDSLPAAHSLSAAILAGLEQSAKLIVVCSPNAVMSKWVALEIETFRELNPDGDILAVVIKGDPGARDGANACFPAALIEDGNEPLAADLRKAGDGSRLGFFKLVAALSAEPLEALLRRDQARSRRRVMAITAGATTITLGMTALAAVAVTARQEAEARRADAEGLVDFMLTDLRDRLEPVGRLDVLDGVALRALSYYDGVADEALGCDGAGRKARALQFSSEIKYEAGAFDSAALDAQQAFDLTSSRLVESGAHNACDDPRETQIDHANSVYYLSFADWAQGDQQALEEKMQVYGDLIERHCELEPGTEACQINRAYLHINNGVTKHYAGDQAGAEIDIKEAIDAYTQAPSFEQDKFKTRREHANGYGWLADVYFRSNEFGKAIEARQEEFRLYEDIRTLRLARYHKSEIQLRRDLAGAQLGLARALIKDGEGELALSILGSLSDVADDLTRLDGDNEEWRTFRLWVLGAKALAYHVTDAAERSCTLMAEARRYESSSNLPAETLSKFIARAGFDPNEFC